MDNSPGRRFPPGNSSFLSWEQTCHLLGGGSWGEASQDGSSSFPPTQHMNSLDCLAEQFSNRPQFFFSSAHQPPWPLEIFWLKWRLLTSLARKLFAFHSTNRTPYLDLCPGRVNVEYPSLDDPTLPSRWSFSPFFPAEECAIPYTPQSLSPLPPDFPSALFQPPHGYDPAFAHPWLQSFTLGQQESVTALIRSIAPSPPSSEGAGVTQGLFTIHLFSDTFSSQPFSDKDVFFVRVPPLSGSSGSLEMWARTIDSAERGLVVQGKCQPLSTTDWELFRQNQREAFPQTLVTIYCCFHVPCDLYSLGMMIFYTLLGYHPERLNPVTPILPSLLASIEHIVQSVNPADEFEVGYALRRRLAEEGPIFSKDQVVSSPSSLSSGFGSIPDLLWDEALVIAFKLVSHIPGFSFCSHAGDFDLHSPANSMERVVHIMEKLGEGIRLELFGLAPRNNEILRACRVLRQELFPQEAPTSP